MISKEGLRAYSRGGRSKPRAALLVASDQVLRSDRARFVAFCIFAVLVALTGGSSRSDIPALVVLRPLAILFLGYALLCSTRQQLKAVRGPLAIVVSLIIVALLQLVPLPASIWSGLPQRDAIAAASQLIGMEPAPRPLSLDPNRTWNTFFALFIPLSAICLVAVQSESYRRWVIPLMAAVALLSAGVGMLQAVGAPGMHFYKITHEDFPVGLFANKNHQAVTLVWLILFGCWMAATTRTQNPKSHLFLIVAIGQALVLFPLLVLTGSRAGLLLSAPVLALSALLLHRAPATRALVQRLGVRAKLLAGGVATVIVLPLLFALALLAMSDRYTAMTRLFAVDPGQDLRWSYLPVMFQMGQDYLPFGSGLGSFEVVFHAYEPDETLRSSYMNLAHNDPLQLMIEAGVPALAIVLSALLWLASTTLTLWRTSLWRYQSLALFTGGSAVIWLLASLVDYPLRTPLAGMLVAVLTAYSSMRSYEARRVTHPSGG